MHIEVWLDTISDPDAPEWCVSLCDADGEEREALFLGSEDDATEEAKMEADERGIPAFVRAAQGQLEPLA